MKVIIGSRGSELALWQAHHVQDQLEKLGHEVTIKVISTQGDRIQHLSFDKMEGKGFFTKEIEAALLNKEIDLAVHSHKDLETTSPEGLMIAAVSSRENPAELLLVRKESVDTSEKWNLKRNAVVGTSSARRKSQLMAYRGDVELKDLRGNVPTRIQKLRDGNYDAIMLAAAGVTRLEIDLSEFHAEELSPIEFIPAPAQGVLGLQIRSEDNDLMEALSALNDSKVQSLIAKERAVLKLLNGGCQLPLGVYAPEEDRVYVAFAKKWENGAIYKEYKSESPHEIVEELKA